MYDVAIIGAGPSGSYTAYLLARSGYKVAILDKDKKIGEPVVCTGIVSEEACRKFSLPKEAILKDINSFKLISPSGETFRYQHIDPFAHVLDRGLFDALLLKQAKDEGADFFSESYVIGLRSGDREIKITYRAREFHNTIRAKTVVIAIGLCSSLIERIGLKRPDSFLKGIQAEVEGDGFDDVEVYIGEKIAPGSFAWAVPIGNGRVRLGLTCEGDLLKYFKNLTKVPSISERIKDGEIRVNCRPVAYGMSKKTYKERILLVGDAAGQVKTTTGGGIYYGLIGAELASQTLINALRRNDFSESTMGRYERLWKERLGQEIRKGIKMREIYAKLSDTKIDFLIKFASRDGVVPLIRNRAKFDWQKNFFLSLLKKPMVRRILF